MGVSSLGIRVPLRAWMSFLIRVVFWIRSSSSNTRACQEPSALLDTYESGVDVDDRLGPYCTLLQEPDETGDLSTAASAW